MSNFSFFLLIQYKDQEPLPNPICLPEEESQKHGSKPVSQILEKYRLTRLLSPLSEMGVEEIDDFEYVEEDELLKLDLKIIEKKKFVKMMKELSFDG